MKTCISLIAYLCYVACTYAQSNLYEETKLIQGDGYTYQCKVVGILADLYNTNQQFVEQTQINRKTGKNSSIKDSYTPKFERDTWTRPKCYSIVRNAFSEEEKQKLKGEFLKVSLYIDSNTGNITDVMFSFSNRGKFATIPIAVYRKIELELKKNIWFTMTEHGKNFNYALLWWKQTVSK